MRDIKKSLKNVNGQKTTKKNNMIMENPFILAIIVFAAAFLINYWLELDFTKNLFNWIGYYFNYSLFWLNSVIQPIFKNHPYIHIPVLTNPITPQIMSYINPWMWLRGFIISSFAAAQTITLLQVKIIKSKNIVIASILIGFVQYVLYVLPYGVAISPLILTSLLQKNYINLIALIVVCIAGLLAGVEYAIYLYRNEKILVDERKEGLKVNIEFTDRFNW